MSYRKDLMKIGSTHINGGQKLPQPPLASAPLETLAALVPGYYHSDQVVSDDDSEYINSLSRSWMPGEQIRSSTTTPYDAYL